MALYSNASFNFYFCLYHFKTKHFLNRRLLKTLSPTLQNMTASALQKPVCLYCHAKYSVRKVEKILESGQLAQINHYALKELLLSFCNSDEDRRGREILFFLASSKSSLVGHSLLYGVRTLSWSVA